MLGLALKNLPGQERDAGFDHGDLGHLAVCSTG